MLISRPRCATRYEITLYTPNVARSSATVPNTPTSSSTNRWLSTDRPMMSSTVRNRIGMSERTCVNDRRAAAMADVSCAAAMMTYMSWLLPVRWSKST